MNARVTETTKDAFLSGRLTLEQPAKGYRAGVDPVLLAAAAKARAGQSVLELGCGVGAAMFCLAARVPDLTLTGVELQAPYADLCRANATANGFDAAIHTADLQDLPLDLREQSFDHVIANPPYFHQARHRLNLDAGRDIAFRGPTPLADWLSVAFKRLKPKGWLTLIQRADRLPDVLKGLDDRFGAITVVPIVGRTGRDADRFILRTRKHGMTPFVLKSPVALHTGPDHIADGDDYAPDIAAVLRNGAAFPEPA